MWTTRLAHARSTFARVIASRPRHILGGNEDAKPETAPAKLALVEHSVKNPSGRAECGCCLVGAHPLRRRHSGELATSARQDGRAADTRTTPSEVVVRMWCNRGADAVRRPGGRQNRRSEGGR